MFGESFPTISELLAQARAVFEAYADREDPEIAYIFDLDTPALFAR